jgi:hypothetical protein
VLLLLLPFIPIIHFCRLLFFLLALDHNVSKQGFPFITHASSEKRKEKSEFLKIKVSLSFAPLPLFPFTSRFHLELNQGNIGGGGVGSAAALLSRVTKGG